MTKAHPEDFFARYREIVSDPLNLLIHRHPDAGSFDADFVVLHNGLKVAAAGEKAYYDQFSAIFCINRGVHEPLEEFVFQEVLKVLPSAPTMLELGAYWGHYSMWLKHLRPEGRVFLVEPDPRNFASGLFNFQTNNLQGNFARLMVGKGQMEVDRYLKDQEIEKLDILHSDIQGAEFEMLGGAEQSLDRKVVDYLFVSTHSDEIHQQCQDLLRRHDYRVEVEVDFESESTSLDGFILASSPKVTQVFHNFKPMTRLEILNATPAELLDYLQKVQKATAAPATAVVDFSQIQAVKS